MKNIVDAGENILKNLKKAHNHNMKILSPLGVHLFTDFISCGDDLDNKVALALYDEGILKYSMNDITKV